MENFSKNYVKRKTVLNNVVQMKQQKNVPLSLLTWSVLFRLKISRPQTSVLHWEKIEITFWACIFHMHTNTDEQDDPKWKTKSNILIVIVSLWWLPDASVYTLGPVAFSGATGTHGFVYYVQGVYERKMFMLCLIELISHLSIAFVCCFISCFLGRSCWNISKHTGKC